MSLGYEKEFFSALWAYLFSQYDFQNMEYDNSTTASATVLVFVFGLVTRHSDMVGTK